jgi:hypothetical protein
MEGLGEGRNGTATAMADSNTLPITKYSQPMLGPKSSPDDDNEHKRARLSMQRLSVWRRRYAEGTVELGGAPMKSHPN